TLKEDFRPSSFDLMKASTAALPLSSAAGSSLAAERAASGRTSAAAISTASGRVGFMVCPQEERLETKDRAHPPSSQNSDGCGRLEEWARYVTARPGGPTPT